MSSFTQGLKDKIAGLRDEREELEDSLSRIDTKIETLEELLNEEEGTSTTTADKPKRRRGRPKGSKKKTAEATTPNAHLYDEAVATLPEAGTTPEQQEKLVNRYRPTARADDRGSGKSGPGITTGTLKDVKNKRKNATPKSDKTISVEDE